MWFGTFAGGVNILNKNGDHFLHFKHTRDDNSLGNNNVLSITPNAQKKIWIGTDGGGLDLFDPLTASFRHFRHQPGNDNSICGDYVLSTREDKKGNLWIDAHGRTAYRYYNPRTSIPGGISGMTTTTHAASAATMPTTYSRIAAVISGSALMAASWIFIIPRTAASATMPTKRMTRPASTIKRYTPCSKTAKDVSGWPPTAAA